MQSAGVCKARGKKRKLKDSKSDEWRTGKEIFKWLNDIYHFVADVAADHHNHLCEKYITKQQNALYVNWADCFCTTAKIEWVFLNCPFSNIEDWLKKAAIEMNKGLGVVMLLPYTGQLYWKELVVEKATKIYMIYGRLPYLHPETGMPHKKCNFPSAIVIFDPSGKGAYPVEFTEWISQDVWMKRF